MKKLIFAAMAALTVIASSCYEDKGSYDYHDFCPIDSIKKHWNSASESGLMVGDTAHFIMRVVFKDPNENLDDWKFVWRVNNEDVAEGLEYDYIPKKLGTDYFQFYAENKKTGMRFYQPQPSSYTYTQGYWSIAVKSQMSKGGWHILSKKDGNVSCIDVLLRIQDYEYFINEEGEEDWYYVYTYDEKKDYYKTVTGEELGTNPIRMYEYYPQYSEGPEVLLFQGNNNDGAMFIDRLNFDKVCTLQDEFYDRKYPNGSYVTDFYYGGASNWVTTSDGKLYSVIMGLTGGTSTNINAYSHVMKFLSTPLELGNGSFAKKFLAHNAFINGTQSIIVYDSGLNTIKFFWTSYSSGNYYQGVPITNIELTDLTSAKVPSDSYFQQAHVLGDYELQEWYLMSGKASSGPYRVMAVKKHKETGKLVYDYIEFKGGSRSKITIKIIEENAEFPEGFNENTIYSVNRVNKYFWYVDGNKIMFYDPNPATKALRHYTTIEGEVTALTVGPGGDSRQKQQLAVGYADKRVIFYNIGDNVIQEAATSGDAKNYGDKGEGDRFIYWETTATGVPMQIEARPNTLSKQGSDGID